MLQRLAREEIGGTPAQVPRAYAVRSPDHYARQIARSGVPLQLYWSSRDRIIRDQRLETSRSRSRSRDDDDARLWDFHGDWSHTAEMQPDRRLPRALARFELLPWADVPPVPARRAPGSRLTSAASRSASRSSADSIPTDRRTRFAGRRERRAGGRRVRHPRRMLDQALDAAERLGELEELRARDELDRLLLGLDEERDHAAEVAHLRARDLVARV